MNNTEKKPLVTVQEFAILAGKKPQTIYKQLNNRLNPYVQLVDNQKMLRIQALQEIYGIAAEQPIQPELNKSFNSENDEIRFLRRQVEQLQTELIKEREHNREKDQQLLNTLSKLAEGQAALSAGQAAEKQKALAEKIIEGQQIKGVGTDPTVPDETPPKKQGFLARVFGKEK